MIATVVLAIVIGVIGAWLLHRARGGQFGVPSWRDGGRDDD